MPRLSISYRRSDSEAVTGRIFDLLIRHCGRKSVFRDVDNVPVGVDFRMEYDPIATERNLVGFGLNGVVRMNAIDVTAGWSRQNYQSGNQFTSNNYIQESTRFHLAGNKIGGLVQFNYDIGRSTLLNQRYVANYSAQCCGFAIEYQAYNFPGSFVVPQDRRINFSFTLAGIGSFSNFFGNFGGSPGF